MLVTGGQFAATWWRGTAGHGDGMFSEGNYFSQDLDRIFICYLYFFIIIIIIKIKPSGTAGHGDGMFSEGN